MKNLTFKIILLNFLILIPFILKAQTTNYIKIENTAQIIPDEKRKCYQDNSKQRVDCLNKLFDSSLSEFLKNKNAISEIKKAAKIYNIKPSIIAAAILGEHIFNYDYTDVYQDKLALKLAPDKYNESKLKKYLSYRDRCSNIVTEYFKWICINNSIINEVGYKDNIELWDTVKYAKRSFFNERFLSGSYGLVQMQPLRLLMVTDLVSTKSGFKKLSLEYPHEIIESLTNDLESIHYVAASIYYTILIYKKFSVFDISESHGITSTLYNLGSEIVRAKSINLAYSKDIKVRPQMNYYGWLLEYRKKDLISAFD